MSDHTGDNPHSTGQSPSGESPLIGAHPQTTNPQSKGTDASPDANGSQSNGSTASVNPIRKDFDLENEKTVISPKNSLLQTRPVHSSESIALDQLEGTSLGHLHLKEYLGGGMSAVYRAVDESLARLVAVKILLPELKNEEYLRRFRNEAKNSARLDHENIARVYYIGSFGDLDYIVFEYVEGDNLKQLVDKIGPMSLDLAIRYTLQIAAALQHAYQRDVTHRDVKPSNAIITKGGRVKLVDMGLARFQNSNMHGDDVTSAGVTMGTFDYISPEQARDARSVDVRSDLYSLGCTMFYLLTGHPPYPDGTPIEKIMQHSNAQRPDPRMFRDDLPRELSRIIKKLLAPNPELRYQTPDKLINDLMALAGGNQIQLYGFEQAMVSSKKQRDSLIERVLPVAIPVATIVAVLLAWEWFDSGRNSSVEDSEFVFSRQNQSATALSNGSVESVSEKTDSLAREGDASRTDDVTVENSGDNDVAKKDSTDADQVATEVNPVGENLRDAETSETNQSPVYPPAVVEQCFVGDFDGETLPSNSAYFNTLDEALLAVSAGKYPAMRTVQLHFDGVQMVSAANLNSAKLDIQGGDGFAPILAFDADKDLKLLRMHSGEVKFDRVHFRVLCPEAGIRDGITLFDIQQPQVLSLNNCSITIVNSDEQNRRFQDDVAVVRIQPSIRSRMAFPEDANSMTDPPFISFSNCIVRGTATTIKSTAAAPFFMSFDNGLVVTPERMVELGGDQEEPGMLNYDHPEIELRHVTSITGSGLVQMYLTGSKPFHRKLSIRSDNCIFKVGSGALVEHFNLDPNSELSRDDWTDVLRLQGEQNYFPENYPVWAMSYTEGEASQIELSLEEALSPTTADGQPTSNDWFEQEEARTLSTVVWQSSGISSVKPYHLQFPGDYLLSGGASNPAVRRSAGFEAAQLPEIPVDSKQISTRNYD